MAKKLKRVRTPLWMLFIQLLIPWVAMGLIAVAATYAGAPSYLVFILAIAGALIVTWAIHWLGKNRRRNMRRG
jgi:predicted PurR-regulated permease PerM